MVSKINSGLPPTESLLAVFHFFGVQLRNCGPVKPIMAKVTKKVIYCKGYETEMDNDVTEWIQVKLDGIK